jgi:hypothetical protein
MKLSAFFIVVFAALGKLKNKINRVVYDIIFNFSQHFSPRASVPEDQPVSQEHVAQALLHHHRHQLQDVEKAAAVKKSAVHDEAAIKHAIEASTIFSIGRKSFYLIQTSFEPD